MTEIDLTPITRLEYDIDAILNDHAVAEPITRIELILADIVAGNTTTVEPVTRIETYLAIISGADYPVPEPVTRIETFLAIIAGEDYEEPEAVTRLEGLLAEWVEKGSGIWKTVTGTLIHITDALASPMQKCEVSLEPIQDLHGQDAPYPAGGGSNIFHGEVGTKYTATVTSGKITVSCKASGTGSVYFKIYDSEETELNSWAINSYGSDGLRYKTITMQSCSYWAFTVGSSTSASELKIEVGETPTPFANICPITGWTGCKVTRTGKNLFDLNEYTLGGATEVENPEPPWDQYVDRYSGNKYSFYYLHGDCSTNPSATGLIPRKPYGRLTISFVKGYSNNDRVWFHYTDANAWVNTSGGITSSGYKSYTSAEGRICDGVALDTTQGSASTFWFAEMQIEIADGATSYEHPNRTTYPISWQTEAGTVYGGTLDVVNGTLTSKLKIFQYSSVSYYGTYQGHPLYYADIPNASTEPIKEYISSSSKSFLASNYFVKNSASSYSSMGDCMIRTAEAAKPSRFYFRYDSAVSISALNDLLAVTPLQVVAELATPVEVQLTPQQISTLAGENNIWADVNGEITLTYKANA